MSTSSVIITKRLRIYDSGTLCSLCPKKKHFHNCILKLELINYGDIKDVLDTINDECETDLDINDVFLKIKDEFKDAKKASLILSDLSQLEFLYEF